VDHGHVVGGWPSVVRRRPLVVGRQVIIASEKGQRRRD
jgi:hypothetical protein